MKSNNDIQLDYFLINNWKFFFIHIKTNKCEILFNITIHNTLIAVHKKRQTIVCNRKYSYNRSLSVIDNFMNIHKINFSNCLSIIWFIMMYYSIANVLFNLTINLCKITISHEKSQHEYCFLCDREIGRITFHN